ncbi:hypothetical protein [Peribacillus simplex]|uniref:hypothetical protein n=1 Tax=Peribacillus simplex TaxID=1478 RepID=UPI002853029C|nr:hypothetical protein [Peribacillus simplex]MDR4927235.1 hypothetical protein [Peribacillus simplex]
MSFKVFLLPTLIQFIAWLLFYLMVGGEDWYKNNLPQIIFAALVSFLTYIVGTITLFFRPVFIKVKQHNIMENSIKETVIDIQRDKCKTLQNQRTISLQIIVERRGSIWWRIFNHLLKSHSVRLKISLRPPKLALIQEEFLFNIKTNESQGFDIILNSYFHELFRSNSDYSIEETHRYYVSYQYDFHVVNNAQYIIDPLIELEPVIHSKLNSFKGCCLRWLLKREIESHKLRISRR